MSADFPLTHLVRAADVPAGGLRRHLDLDAEERAALARYLGIPAVARLEAEFLLSRRGAGELHLALSYEGRLTRTCVVSLDEFETGIAGTAERGFSLSASPERELPPDVDPSDEVDLDPMPGGIIDLGAVLSEELALGLDPYPRKPGATLAAEPAAGEAGGSAFAALGKLKNGKRS